MSRDSAVLLITVAMFATLCLCGCKHIQKRQIKITTREVHYGYIVH